VPAVVAVAVVLGVARAEDGAVKKGVANFTGA
jgi:hypothetical protein